MFDKFVNWMLICITFLVIYGFLFILPGCAYMDKATKATKGVVTIYKEAASKVDDLHKYCIEMHAFLGACQVDECRRMLTRHIYFCDSADKFLNKVQDIKDDILLDK